MQVTLPAFLPTVKITGILEREVRNTEDNEIIRLLFARDEHAILAANEKYGALCMYTAMQILQRREDAEECVNDAYLRLWNAVPPERPAHLTGFLLTLVRCAALDRCDLTHRKKRGGGETAAVLDELESVLPAKEDVQQQAEQHAVGEAILRFVSALPEKQRRMMLKRYWYLQNSREIAEDMQVPESTVRVTLLRLREKLRAFLEKEDLL